MIWRFCNQMEGVEMFVKLVSKKEDKNENEIISHKMKRLSGNQ